MQPHHDQPEEKPARVYIIPRASVLAGETNLAPLLARVVDDLHKKQALLQWELSISGYETDARHLAEIPEVRAWCTKVHARTPYLPFILTDPAWYLLCVVGVKPVGKDPTRGETLFWMDSKTLRQLLLEQAGWLEQFGREYRLSPAEMAIVMEKGSRPVAQILRDWAAQAGPPG
jgi:hypothetical protein